MPHHAGNSNEFELARGKAGSRSSTLPSLVTPFHAQLIAPTTSASSPPYHRTGPLNGAPRIDSYNNHQWSTMNKYDSVHRVEPSPSGTSRNSYKRSQGGSLTAREQQRSSAKNFHQPYKAASVDSAEAAAASALLLASTEVNAERCSKDVYASDATTDVPEWPEGNVPFKKRKKHLDFLRRNQGVYEASNVSRKGQPCHISPVSSSSIGSIVNVDDHNPEEALSAASSKEALLSSAGQLELSASRADSYEFKETQALPETAKIKGSTDIQSSLVLVVPHFPTILHDALTHMEFSSILHWLSHGKAWKVLRWDALRRDVLPQCFPQLREDEDKGYGSIDAFLLQVRVWGFEEIIDGPDVGAYRHKMFLRENPNLCQSMCLLLDGGEGTSPPKHKASGAPSQTPTSTAACSFLRVPSLRTKVACDAAPTLSVSPITRPGADFNKSCNAETPCADHRSVPRRLSPHPTWPPGRATETVAPSHTYRPDESMTSFSDSWLPHPSETSFLTRIPTTPSRAPPNLDFRFPFRPSSVTAESGHHHQMQCSNQAQHLLPQVRSGRGALRVTTRNRSREQPSRSVGGTSYPISHRGRGTGFSSACRKPLPCADLSPSLSTALRRPSNVATEAVMVDSRFGPPDAIAASSCKNSKAEGHLRNNLIDTSTTTKCKRKLPMARKSSLPAADNLQEP